jgi:hypothetical protein
VRLAIDSERLVDEGGNTTGIVAAKLDSLAASRPARF